MTDDIVERLRQWTRCKSQYPTRSLDDDMEEAAAEIERLRDSSLYVPSEPWNKVERRKDNWTLITKEYTPKIGFKYKDTSNGRIYTFFGIVHADDDYYYGLLADDVRGRGLVLSSCVGDIESFYEQVPNGGKCVYCGTVFMDKPEKCDRFRCLYGDNPLDISPRSEKA